MDFLTQPTTAPLVDIFLMHYSVCPEIASRSRAELYLDEDKP